MRMEAERNELVAFGRKMLSCGLTTGTGGNLSVRDAGSGLVAITPSGIDYEALAPGDVAVVDGDGREVEGNRRPSSELGLHLALYRSRPEAASVIHTHSVYATTLACLHWEIPAVHYLVGFAGKKVPVAPYATFGTEALARGVAETIGGHNAVLLANHGLVAVGTDLPRAFAVAEEIEMVARIYYLARCAGEPQILDDDEMDRVIEKFKGYGRQD